MYHYSSHIKCLAYIIVMVLRSTVLSKTIPYPPSKLLTLENACAGKDLAGLAGESKGEGVTGAKVKVVR